MIKGATVILAGYVASEPSYRTVRGATPITSLRVAWTERYLDRVTGEWRDGNTSFATVNCWRGLASNAASSLRKGQAVVVTGRLQIRQSGEKEGNRRIYVEIEADAIGHNLSRGVTHFMRTHRSPGDEAAAVGAAVDHAADLESPDQSQADADGPGRPGAAIQADDEPEGGREVFEAGPIAELAEAEASAAAADETAADEAEASPMAVAAPF